MTSARFCYALGFLLAGLGFSQPARAQGDADARALAVQLFDEAEKLFAGGQTAIACPKYAESYRLDPQLGVLIYLAECYEKQGRLASAWGSFREAAEVAQKRDDPRGAHATERARALEPRLSYVVIQVPEAARVDGLQLLRDGATLAPVLWGERAAIDAGKHHIEARAPGFLPWSAEFNVGTEGSSTSVAVPKLKPDPKAAASPGDRHGDAAPGTSQRIAAIAVGGLGVVAIGVGGYFGLSAQSSYGDSKDLCSADGICTEDGAELRATAQNKAVVATVATSVGLAALVTAGVLWFTAPKGERAAARRPRAVALGPSRSGWGLEVSGAF